MQISEKKSQMRLKKSQIQAALRPFAGMRCSKSDNWTTAVVELTRPPPALEEAAAAAVATLAVGTFLGLHKLPRASSVVLHFPPSEPCDPCRVKSHHVDRLA